MHRLMLLPLLALLACNGPASDKGSDKSDTDTDSDSDTTTETDTTVDTDTQLGEVVREGHVLLSQPLRGRDSRGPIQARAFFVDALPDVVLPIACIFDGQLCFSSLPEVPDEGIDVAPFELPSTLGTVDVGPTITVGDLTLDRVAFEPPVDTDVDTDTDAPVPTVGITTPETFYGTTLEAWPDTLGTRDITVGGDWGQTFTALDVMPALDVVSPSPNVQLVLRQGAQIPFRWEVAEPGRMYLYADFGAQGRRLYLLEDDGAFRLPVDDFGNVGSGTWAGHITLFRITTSDSQVGDALLHTNAVSYLSWEVGTQPLTCGSLRASDRRIITGGQTIYADVLPRTVWCDMDADGGGWTLVASSSLPFDDQRAPYNINLLQVNPTGTMNGIWDGLRTTLDGAPTDMRFACKANGSPTYTVDLSFRRVGWYQELTAGVDAVTCFSEGEGEGYDTPAPARRNNITSVGLPKGDDWNAGFLQGERTCGDTTSFTIDFDDGGVSGNPADGTDWGENISARKCGTTVNSGKWFVFIRE